MIVLFTDFGADDIYVAQVKARLLETAPSGTVVTDLLHSVPDFDPRAGAHLLAALQSHFPLGAVGNSTAC
ncbi:MAG TPA: SAM-dependent chlorinase/fluorinase [Hyphomonadaceae bacterium]|jgi:S-adenosylmethionine hydrolase